MGLRWCFAVAMLQIVSRAVPESALPGRQRQSCQATTSWQGTQQKCAALSQWLQAHAAAAPLESISVQGYGSDRSTLKLPVEQLPKLRKLCLRGVSVSVQGQSCHHA